MAEQQTEVDFPFFDRSTRKLRFHFDEYLELETRTGRAPTEFLANIMKLSPSDLRLALWVGLKWQEAPGTRKLVTLDWVGKQLQKHLAAGKSLMPILRALDEAFSVSGYFQPEADETAGTEAGREPAGPTVAGGSSGSLRVVEPMTTPGME